MHAWVQLKSAVGVWNFWLGFFLALSLGMAESLSFAPHRPRLVAYAATMGMLLALSTAIMFNLERIMHPYLRLAVMIVGFLGCIAFGYGLLYNLMRITQPQPLLEANEDGLWFHVSFFNHGKVVWTDLAGFEVVKYGLSKRVLVKVKDPEAFTEKYPGIRRFLFQRTRKRYGTPISLPLELISGDAVKTLQQLSDFGSRMK
jgi:hypothetical protein